MRAGHATYDYVFRSPDPRGPQLSNGLWTVVHSSRHGASARNHGSGEEKKNHKEGTKQCPYRYPNNRKMTRLRDTSHNDYRTRIQACGPQSEQPSESHAAVFPLGEISIVLVAVPEVVHEKKSENTFSVPS